MFRLLSAHAAACGLAFVLLFGTPAVTTNAAPAPSAPPLGTQVADLADQYVGTPYVWGGASPSGFDCSGLVLWAYSQFNISLPHDAAAQLSVGPAVDLSDLQPGDVLGFGDTYMAGLSHSGIYLGNGQFVHAANEQTGVIVSSLSNSYWGSHLVAASRPWAAAS